MRYIYVYEYHNIDWTENANNNHEKRLIRSSSKLINPLLFKWLPLIIAHAAEQSLSIHWITAG